MLTVLPLSFAILTGCSGGGSSGSGDNSTESASTQSGNSGSGNGGSNTQSAAPQKRQTWYIRLSAEVPSENLADKVNVLGRITDGSAGYDRHDLRELKPQMGSSSYLTLLFPHPGWEKGENYASDYHGLENVSQDSWTFVIRTDNTNRDVTLSWDGAYLFDLEPDSDGNLRYVKHRDENSTYTNAMYLVDVDNNTSVKAMQDGQLQSYTFNMEGKTERTFQWVIDFDGNYTPPPAAQLSGTMQAASVQPAAVQRKKPYNNGDPLGLPPQP